MNVTETFIERNELLETIVVPYWVVERWASVYYSTPKEKSKKMKEDSSSWKREGF